MTTIELDKALMAEEVLARELAEYAGLWVAIRNRTIVESADTIEDLLALVNDPGEFDRIFEVSAEAVAGCLY